MGIFFIYSIKVALCLTAFYLLYKVLLSRETFHSLNRAVLLGVMVLSLMLPLVHVTFSFLPAGGGGMAQVEGFIDAQVIDDAARPDVFTPVQMLFAIYIIGVVFFTGREIRSLLNLFSIMRSGRAVYIEDGVRLIVVKEDISPFSWFGNIIISEKDYEEAPHEILVHEKAHISRHHSADVLMCNLIIIFQWFNPAAWLMKAELQNVHEYEADDAVLACGVDASGYQLLLIRKAVGDRLYSMANNLNHSSLKKRIKMMLSKKSNPRNRVKILFVVPVAMAAVAVFASPVVDNVTDGMRADSDMLLSNFVKEPVSREAWKDGNASYAVTGKSNASAEIGDGLQEEPASGLAKSHGLAQAQTPVTKTGTDDDKVYNAVEVMPKFPGGMTELIKYLSDNIRYPEAAVKSKKEGRVIVQFVVCKDGSVGDITVLKGVSTELDAEAVRVVGTMPKWEPGLVDGKPVNVKYTLPISFSLK